MGRPAAAASARLFGAAHPAAPPLADAFDVPPVPAAAAAAASSAAATPTSPPRNGVGDDEAGEGSQDEGSQDGEERASPRRMRSGRRSRRRRRWRRLSPVLAFSRATASDAAVRERQVAAAAARARGATVVGAIKGRKRKAAASDADGAEAPPALQQAVGALLSAPAATSAADTVGRCPRRAASRCFSEHSGGVGVGGGDGGGGGAAESDARDGEPCGQRGEGGAPRGDGPARAECARRLPASWCARREQDGAKGEKVTDVEDARVTALFSRLVAAEACGGVARDEPRGVEDVVVDVAVTLELKAGGVGVDGPTL